jgi:hypothetical protein
MLGSSSQFKSLLLEHSQYPFDLQFIDLQLYLAGGTLEQNAEVFSNSDKKQKKY